jgi:hypothetical protein
MLFFDIGTKEHRPFSLLVSCPEEGLTFWGTTRDITTQEFCMEVPTTRIKASLMEFIAKSVLIRFENVTIEGAIQWYTIEGDYYIISIGVRKSCRSAWKELIAASDRAAVKGARVHQGIS